MLGIDTDEWDNRNLVESRQYIRGVIASTGASKAEDFSMWPLNHLSEEI